MISVGTTASTSSASTAGSLDVVACELTTVAQSTKAAELKSVLQCILLIDRMCCRWGRGRSERFEKIWISKGPDEQKCYRKENTQRRVGGVLVGLPAMRSTALVESYDCPAPLRDLKAEGHQG